MIGAPITRCESHGDAMQTDRRMQNPGQFLRAELVHSKPTQPPLQDPSSAAPTIDRFECTAVRTLVCYVPPLLYVPLLCSLQVTLGGFPPTQRDGWFGDIISSQGRFLSTKLLLKYAEPYTAAAGPPGGPHPGYREPRCALEDPVSDSFARKPGVPSRALPPMYGRSP